MGDGFWSVSYSVLTPKFDDSPELVIRATSAIYSDTIVCWSPPHERKGGGGGRHRNRDLVHRAGAGNVPYVLSMLC